VTRVYDLAMTHNLDADEFFIHRVQWHCAASGMSFFLVEPLWVERFLDLFERGDIQVKCLLNMHSEHHLPEDIFHRLVKLAEERGSQVIDPPSIAIAAFDKARLHRRLLEAGVPVPHTLIVPRSEVGAFQLSETDRAALGTLFVIKPGMGYGKRGVVLDATSEADLQRSVAAWKDQSYLVQRRIIPRLLGDEPAYFRVFFVFGTVWTAWWNCYTDRYRLLTEEERAIHRLAGLEDIIRRIAALTGMNFFSSEMAQTESGDFVVIDYVNDQCHTLSQSANPRMGVPDQLVAALAEHLVAGARSLIAGL